MKTHATDCLDDRGGAGGGPMALVAERLVRPTAPMRAVPDPA